MGLIILLIPLAIYYFLIFPIVKIFIINRKVKNTLYKRVLTFLLLILPFFDHILGFTLYKTLCLTTTGSTIYENANEEKEQKKFWFTAFKYGYPNSLINRHNFYGINADIYFTKDLQQHKLVYWNECNTKRLNSYDCQKAKKYIRDKNLTIHQKIFHKEDDLKLFNYGRHNKLSTTYLVNENKLTPAFLNECNKDYDSLPKNDKNFKNSCKYTSDFIKRNNLENIITIPDSKYSVSTENKYFYPFLIRRETVIIKDSETKKVIAKNISYDFYGGLYINSFSPYKTSSVSCKEYKTTQSFVREIISNPYKNTLY